LRIWRGAKLAAARPGVAPHLKTVRMKTRGENGERAAAAAAAKIYLALRRHATRGGWRAELLM